MTISSKLAVDFVKRYFGAFEFDSQPTKSTTINAYHIRQAYITVDCAVDFHPFHLDTGSTGCMMMFLPERLKADKSTLDEMLNQVEREDMDMSSLIAGPNKSYRVTTNRLRVLEQLMIRSGSLRQVPGFSKTQQALLNEKISQLEDVVRQNYNTPVRMSNLERLFATVFKKKTDSNNTTRVIQVKRNIAFIEVGDKSIQHAMYAGGDNVRICWSTADDKRVSNQIDNVINAYNCAIKEFRSIVAELELAKANGATHVIDSSYCKPEHFQF